MSQAFPNKTWHTELLKYSSILILKETWETPEKKTDENQTRPYEVLSLLFYNPLLQTLHRYSGHFYLGFWEMQCGTTEF